MLGISSGLMYGGALQQDTAFRSTWDTRTPSYIDDDPELAVESSAVDTIILPLTGTTGHDFTIWWGDPANSSTQVLADRDVSANPVSFTYDDAGVYEIAIEGVIGHKWQFGSGANDRKKITNVSNWGTFTTGAETYGFHKCSNMICTATDSLTIGGTTMAYWFSGTAIVTINTSSWELGNVVSFESTFAYCSSLVTIDTSRWDTSSWNQIRNAFNGCTNLSVIDVSGWDMRGVRDCEYLFAYNTSLTGNALDVSGWRFQEHGAFPAEDPQTNSIHVRYMFFGCTGLTELDVSNWTTSGIDTFSGIFLNCSNIAVLNTSTWNTRSAIKINSLFHNCLNLEVAQVASSGSYIWNTSSVTDMSNMFNNCPKITTIPVAGWDISNVTSCGRFALNCSEITSFPADDWEFDEMLTPYEMLRGCVKLETIDTTDWQLPKATNCHEMFRDCESLQTLVCTNWGMGDATNINSLFQNCELVEVLNVANWDVTNVTTMTSLFADCTALTTAGIAGVGNWNNGSPSTTAKITTMAGAFSNCTTLTTIPISDWDVREVTSMDNLFFGCTNLVDSAGGLDVSSWVTSKLQTMFRTFRSCTNLITINISGWDMAEVTSLKEAFAYCTSCTALDVSNWNVSSLLDAEYAFHSCIALANNSLDVSDWNSSPSSTTSITNTSWMFHSLNVGNIVVTDWDVRGVIDMSGMFYNSDIIALDVSGWNTFPSSTAQVKSMRKFVSQCTDLADLNVSSLDTSGVEDLNQFFASTPCASSVYADIKHWDISSLKERGQENWEGNTVTDSGLNGLLSGTTNEMSTVEYDAVLVAWEGYNTSNMTVDFDAAQASSSGAGADAHAALVNRGWTITDGDSQ